ncbi:pirin family protein [Pseudohongiella spirulinae]|uniref:Pirin n=1 Tax=Pseudohongiella spirulinae TaxID=1249552 RepID=A0A0S2KE69_9GAMM|nr:pirin family protein [Pseudohongiella spirulinae]ALO46453.1 Pirin [Pseudohongiella spirulinae]
MAKLLKGDNKDLGGFSVSRILPHPEKKMVGPFIFFDHIGPAQFPAGQGINVRPHPHIGLATVTYLFEGSMLHRDSLGSVQEIFPGDVNWMIAGRGIVHSERETHEVRSKDHPLYGLQLWVALPQDHETIEPDFQHISKNDLPCIYRPGIMMRLIVGNAYGRGSPVRTFSPMFYLDVMLDKGRQLEHPDPEQEAAICVVSGTVLINDTSYTKGDFVLLESGDTLIRAQDDARFAMIGGKKFEQVPHIHWNFVAYDRATINAARERWENGEFPAIPGDDEERIPLP